MKEDEPQPLFSEEEKKEKEAHEDESLKPEMPITKRSLWVHLMSFLKAVFVDKKKLQIAQLQSEVERIHEVIEYHKLDDRFGNGLIFYLENLTDKEIHDVDILSPQRFIDMKNPNEIRTKEYVLTYGAPNVSLRDAYMILSFSKHLINKIKLIAPKEVLKGTDMVTFFERDIFGRVLTNPSILLIDSYQFQEGMVELHHRYNVTALSSFIIPRLLPKSKITVILYPPSSLRFSAFK